MKTTECEFEVTQDGLTVAKGSGPHDAAVAEAIHYAMMYGQDGSVSWNVWEISRSASGKRRRKTVLKGSLQGVSISVSGLPALERREG